MQPADQLDAIMSYFDQLLLDAKDDCKDVLVSLGEKLLTDAHADALRARIPKVQTAGTCYRNFSQTPSSAVTGQARKQIGGGGVLIFVFLVGSMCFCYRV